MIGLALILSSLALGGVGWIWYHFRALINGPINKPGSMVLPPLPKRMETLDVDPGAHLLQDVIHTARAEAWIPEVEQVRIYYHINVRNADHSIIIQARVCKEASGKLGLRRLDLHQPGSGSLIYPVDHPLIEACGLEFLWNYCILPYHQQIQDQDQTQLERTAAAIAQRLTAIRRSQKLDHLEI